MDDASPDGPDAGKLLMDRKPPVSNVQQAQREARLAEQLRSNLARRKAQSRSRREQEKDAAPEAVNLPEDEA